MAPWGKKAPPTPQQPPKAVPFWERLGKPPSPRPTRDDDDSHVSKGVRVRFKSIIAHNNIHGVVLPYTAEEEEEEEEEGVLSRLQLPLKVRNSGSSLDPFQISLALCLLMRARTFHRFHLQCLAPPRLVQVGALRMVVLITWVKANIQRCRMTLCGRGGACPRLKHTRERR